MAHFSFELGFEYGAPLNTSKMWSSDEEAILHGKALSGRWPDALFIEVREGSRIVYGTKARAAPAGDDQVGARLDEGLEETFPASDPVAISKVN